MNTLDRATNRSLLANLQWRYAASPRLLLRQQAYVVDAAYRNTVTDGRTREEGGDRDLTWRGSGSLTLGARQGLELGGQLQWQSGWRLDNLLTATGAAPLLDARSHCPRAGASLHPALQYFVG